MGAQATAGTARYRPSGELLAPLAANYDPASLFRMDLRIVPAS